MSVILQGWGSAPGEPFAPLCGGYRLVPGPGPAALDWGDWWQSAQGWLPWPSVVAPAPALWWSWWWAAPLLSGVSAFTSVRGTSAGTCRYRSTGGSPMGAVAVLPTQQTGTLRSYDRLRPFTLDFDPDIAAEDAVSSAQVTVFAHTEQYEPDAPGATPLDVTADHLMGLSWSGAITTIVVGNAKAVVGTQYTLRVVAQMASGMTLQETIGPLVCDM